MNERYDGNQFEALNRSECHSETSSLRRSVILELDDIDALVRKYRPYILLYALSALRDRDLAESLSQDCFLRAFNSRSLYRGVCSVRTWLSPISINLFI